MVVRGRLNPLSGRGREVEGVNGEHRYTVAHHHLLTDTLITRHTYHLLHAGSTPQSPLTSSGGEPSMMLGAGGALKLGLAFGERERESPRPHELVAVAACLPQEPACLPQEPACLPHELCACLPHEPRPSRRRGAGSRRGGASVCVGAVRWWRFSQLPELVRPRSLTSHALRGGCANHGPPSWTV